MYPTADESAGGPTAGKHVSRRCPIRTRLAAASLAPVLLMLPFCPQARAQTDPVVINEVLYNATGPDSLAEWVELRNTSPVAPVSLAGWVLTNAAETQIILLPGVILPPKAFLVVRFRVGPNDFDLSDGAGLYCTGTSAPAFGNSLDAVALYGSLPAGPATLVDFVAWSATGGAPSGPSVVDATASGQWPPGAFVDVSLAGPGFVAPWTEGPGESIGRDGFSSDSNGPADWADHGGAEALAETEGAPNTGPYYSGEDLIYLAQAGVNQFLWEFALNTEGASHVLLSKTESETDVQVIAKHMFQVRSRVDGTTATINGEIACRGQRLPGSAWQLDMSGHLVSTRGMETLDFVAAVIDSGALVGPEAGGTRTAGLLYTTPMGLPVNLDLSYTQRWTWLDPDRLHLIDTRSVTDSRGVSFVRTTQRDQVFLTDMTEEVSLAAVTTYTQPPLAPTEHFQEHGSKSVYASGTMRGVLDLWRIETEGRSLFLLGPSSFAWTRVDPDSLEFDQTMMIGNPNFGYDTAAIHATYGAVIDPTTDEILVRGGVDLLYPGQPLWRLSYYVDDWPDWPWKSISRVLNGGGWATLCAAGIVIGAPTVIGAVIGAGLCGVGGVLGDINIEKHCPPDKGMLSVSGDVPPMLIHFPRDICGPPVGVPDPALSSGLRLGPGGPNPFRGRTTFRYETPGPGRTELIVCDAGGRLVRKLVDRVAEGGQYDATWDGRNDRGVPVPAGTYFVRLLTPYGLRHMAVVRTAP